MLYLYVQTEKVDKIFAYLATLFGEEPRCELNYTTDLELLVAIILSAQCTDKRVNMVTPKLFARYKTIQDYANADVKELENLIYSTGFYHNKAKNIIELCKSITTIPSTIDELVRLPGVGRKTASVFVSEFHKTPAIAVDTHVIRVSNRLGLTKSRNPDIIERDLAAQFDRANWSKYHYYLVLFGRYHCLAKNPKCENCEIKNDCKNN